MSLTVAVPVRYGDVKNLPSVYLNKSYLSSLEHFSVVPVFISPGCPISYYEQVVSFCDGLLLCGGKDIDPIRYHHSIHPSTVLAAKEIDDLDFLCVALFAREKKPVLGICRGIQVINVYFGGTLHQHLPDWSSRINHKQTDRRRDGVHPVIWRKNIAGLCATDTITYVNSLHHQGIDQLAPGFESLAVSPDGLVEAILRDNILGVQWHPEELNQREEERIFGFFTHML